MSKVSLLEFARTGAWGPLRAGNDRGKVCEVLGEPPLWGPSEETIETATIWKYGDFEFHFLDDYLTTIFTDWFEVPNAGDAIEVDPWILHVELMLEPFKGALRNEGISFATSPNKYKNPDEWDVITAAGTLFTFRERDNDYGPAGLCAFCHHNWGE